jgi:hypothetical protein
VVKRFGVASTVIALAIGLNVSPAAARTPKVRVRPARGLTDGQVVTVHWHGFNARKATGGMVVVECTTAYIYSFDGQCATDHELTLPAPQNSGSIAYTVHAELFPSNHAECGRPTSPDNCVIVVAERRRNGFLVFGGSAAAPIHFAT